MQFIDSFDLIILDSDTENWFWFKAFLSWLDHSCIKIPTDGRLVLRKLTDDLFEY